MRFGFQSLPDCNGQFPHFAFYRWIADRLQCEQLPRPALASGNCLGEIVFVSQFRLLQNRSLNQVDREDEIIAAAGVLVRQELPELISARAASENLIIHDKQPPMG